MGVRFVAADHAQVLIPADDDPFGLVRLDEVHGHYEVTGSVRGEAFAYTTPGLLEHVRHG